MSSTDAPAPVVLVAESVGEVVLDALREDHDLRCVDGTDPQALLAALPEASALVVRSRTRVDAEVLAAAPRLKVVARAGVGLENVDVRAATQAGVVVANAPISNLVSSAELTVGLVLAAARRVVPADAALRAGRWERASFTGVELAGRTLGVLGLGRVGTLVAERLLAFGMRVVAHDPYVQAGRAAQLGVRMVPLETLLREADVLTVHLPRTPETTGMVGEAGLALVKATLVLVNASSAGIVDEAALHAALVEGRVGAVGLDVPDLEHDLASPLLALEPVVATPFLGPATVQAQEKAGLAAAASVRLALAGDLVPDAVNVQGGAIAEEVRPGIALVERLGRVFTALAGGTAHQLDVEVRGEIADHDVTVLELAALKGVFADVVEHAVSYVNAPLVAAERGTAVRLVASPESPDHRNLITLRGTLVDGSQVSVSGTLVGIAQRQRLVEVNGYSLDIEPTEHLAFCTYLDRPGVVGTVGGILGEAGVNIAGMQVARERRGGRALAALSVDSAITPEVLAQISRAVEADDARTVTLPA